MVYISVCVPRQWVPASAGNKNKLSETKEHAYFVFVNSEFPDKRSFQKHKFNSFILLFQIRQVISHIIHSLAWSLASWSTSNLNSKLLPRVTVTISSIKLTLSTQNSQDYSISKLQKGLKVHLMQEEKIQSICSKHNLSFHTYPSILLFCSKLISVETLYLKYIKRKWSIKYIFKLTGIIFIFCSWRLTC